MKFTQKEKEIMFDSEFEVLFEIFKHRLSNEEQKEVLDVEMHEGRRQTLHYIRDCVSGIDNFRNILQSSLI
jgi:hypothetical protein